jgi:hypothetical protein
MSERKLIPEAFASALTNVVSIAAMSRIALGDRALESALGMLVTTAFALLVQWIQSKPSWHEVWLCVWSACNLHAFPILCSRALQMWGAKETSASESGIHFDRALAPKRNDVNSFKFKAELTESSCALYPFFNDAFGPDIFSHVNLMSTAKTGDAYTFQMFMQPIWRCSKTGTYVYANCPKEGCRLAFCDAEGPIRDFFAFHYQNVKKRPTSPKLFTFGDALRKDTIGFVSGNLKFDNLFFEQKDELLRLVTAFKEWRLYPSHSGRANTLGILLCGPPGTGKSAVVCAIANLLQRSILVVTGKHMNDRKVLSSAFNDSSYVVYFDEFDVLLNIIRKRGGKEHEDNDERGQTARVMMASKFLEMAVAEKDDEKKKVLMEKYESCVSPQAPVDLAFLLSQIQGVSDVYNRIMIATTNFPDEIDDALKRPGRFDIVLRLGNCTPRMLMDMVCHYFQVTSDERADLEREFPSLPSLVFAPVLVQDVACQCGSARATLTRILELHAQGRHDHQRDAPRDNTSLEDVPLLETVA